MSPVILKEEHVTGSDGNEYVLLYTMPGVPPTGNDMPVVSISVGPRFGNWDEFRERLEQAESPVVVESDQQENA